MSQLRVSLRAACCADDSALCAHLYATARDEPLEKHEVQQCALSRHNESGILQVRSQIEQTLNSDFKDLHGIWFEEKILILLQIIANFDRKTKQIFN